ncbi:hypothetical protein [Nonomuraea dietziae]|uniref:hypothetical protein n=1 Tax=Nonomuraea dietziae TaxID=65515 RepID=UPI0033EA54EB
MRELATSLLYSTRSGHIKWVSTDKEDTFIYSGTRASVTVTSWTDSDGDLNIAMGLLDNHGAVAEVLSSQWGNGPAPWNADLAQLYEAARHSAFDIDSLINSLMSDIDPDGPPF